MARWDGHRWSVTTEADLRDSSNFPLLQPTVAGDGSLWGWVGEDSGKLVRSDGVKWKVIDAFADGSAFTAELVPGAGKRSDEMCVKLTSTATCYHPSGKTRTESVSRLSGGQSVAADGATWVLGAQVARLAAG